MTVLTWNINSVKNKLENLRVLHYLYDAHIVCLNEIKTAQTFSIPGYGSYTSSGDDARHRGGCAMLIRNRLNEELAHMDRSQPDIIQFRFRNNPITFVSCYIPPRDSPYASMDMVARLNSLLCENPDERYMILGDMNSRYANLRDTFLIDNRRTDLYYSPSPDPIDKPNENAKLLIGVVKPLLLINRLCGPNFQFPQRLMYRQKTRWVSELDHIYVSRSLLNAVHSFQIIDDMTLPSNHAPVSVSIALSQIDDRDNILKNLELRAAQIGDHTPASPNRGNRLTRPQIKWSEGISRRMIECLECCEPPDIESTPNIDALFSEIDDSIRSHVSQVELRSDAQDPVADDNANRWKVLADKRDSKNLWKAISWNSSIIDGKDKPDRPGDTEFKTHFEKLLNPTASEPLSIPRTAHMYIPATDDAITPCEVAVCGSVRFQSINYLSNAQDANGIPNGALFTWIQKY